MVLEPRDSGAAADASPAGPPVDEPRPSRARYLGGCWLAIVGYFAGGMLGVAVAKFVGQFTNCRPAQGFPACDFETYFRVGTAVGVVILPAFFIWRLWRNDAARRDAQRG